MTEARRREHADSLLEHARQFVTAARTLLEEAPESFSPAMDLARHAAELAGKVLLLKATGSPPVRSHNIGGAMAAAGVIPRAIVESEISDLLSSHTRARYDYTALFTQGETEAAIEMAETLVAAADVFPGEAFIGAGQWTDPLIDCPPAPFSLAETFIPEASPAR